MEVETRIQGVFRKVFKSEELVVTPTTTAFDIDGWDSLTHVQLMVAVEREFKVKFSSMEIVQLQNVGDLMDLIKSRCK